MYEIEVEPIVPETVVYNQTITSNVSSNLSNVSSTFDTIQWNWQPSSTYPYIYWSYPYTRYMYQLTCPKRGCKTLNWGEIDKIISCKKCGSQIKAVSKKVDFEIEVGE